MIVFLKKSFVFENLKAVVQDADLRPVKDGLLSQNNTLHLLSTCLSIDCLINRLIDMM